MTDDEIFSFAQKKLGSAWALELLLLLYQNPSRTWRHEDLVRELRSSLAVITPCVAALKSAGLVAEDKDGGVRYQAANAELEASTAALARLYASAPMAVAKAIMRAPNDKLSIFSNSFKLKD